MKVGTDSIVLGSWVPVHHAKRILDIGTGTGILSLMLAQRTSHEVIVDAVELDEAAACQAEENINESPWRDRIQVIHQNILTYDAPRYDLIVTNPPYFQHGQEWGNESRQRARHTGELDHASLLQVASRLLKPDGKFGLVLPVDVGASVEFIAKEAGWFVSRRCWIETKRGKVANLVLLLLTRYETGCQEEQLCLRETDNRYSDEFTALADEFYLNMAAAR